MTFSSIDWAILAVAFCVLMFIFYRIKTSNRVGPIVIGDIWVMKNDSPWPNPDAPRVKILDVKDGWVRYARVGTTLYQDERLVDHSFTYIYEKENNQ